jgi:rRNA maturation protein Nop10
MMSWAQRLKRVFAIDIENCPNCGGKLRVAAPAHPAPAALVRPCTSSPVSTTRR